MSRGDRLLSGLIEEAWQRGARLDAWSEHYDLHIWQDAARACNIDMKNYLRRRDFAENLPWQHLETGVDQEFLKAELKKSLTGEYTPDCRVHGCQKCGACDFKQVSPVVRCRPIKYGNSGANEYSLVANGDAAERPFEPESVAAKTNGNDMPHHWYRLSYAKKGDLRFLSHLETIQVLFQAFRRAGVKLHYTKGFNPVPKVSFSPALPVGTESLAEYLDVDFAEKVIDKSELLLRLNKQLPEGIKILAAADMPDKKTAAAVGNITFYAVRLDRKLTPEDINALKDFLAAESFYITKIRKGRSRNLDIRNQVENIEVKEDGKLELIMLQEEGKAAGKPAEIIKAALGLTDEEVLVMRILKVWSRPVINP
ncbi:MAG: DUF2344 domain-containing protein [Deltaproteobacteria bacterium]|jgi:radical SAM-linked protein|nr:DUF2344 domain-containing protein [Deltaproteobacteria bacterium]